MDYAERYNRNRVSWLYALARSEKVGSNAVRVGLLFATFFNAEEREILKPSYTWIMEAAHIKSRTSLRKALLELEQSGFLIIDRMHRYNNEYRMPFDGEANWAGPLSPENGL
jgi:hypothetical protein